jgi:dienelactone hydrolase
MKSFRTKKTPAIVFRRANVLLLVRWMLSIGILAGWLTTNASDWRITYGQSAADYRAAALTLANEGFRPICLDADGAGAASSYSAVWIKDGFTNWLSEIDLTAERLNDRNVALAAEGYRVLCVDSHGTYPAELYAVVWVKDAMSIVSIVDIRDQVCAQLDSRWMVGYVPVWFDLNVSSSMQFATVYSSRAGWWAIYYGMTESDFRQKLQSWSPVGWPSVVRSYQGRFAAVWVDYNWLDSDDCRVELTQSAAELGHAIRQLQKDGYEPVSLTQSSAKFTSIWRRPLASVQPNRIAGLDRLSGGQNQLRIENEVPEDLAQFFETTPVQASTNLMDWEPLTTLRRTNIDSNPTLWIDNQSTDLSMRFYRTPTNRFITPLLEPTGPFGVGEFSQLITDQARFDSRRGTNVQFMVTCWYPAELPKGRLPAPYVADLVARVGGYYTPHSLVAGLVAHSTIGVPVATNASRFPVVLYSPEFSRHRRENLMLVENLASHGFVVVAMDHQNTRASVCPDGTPICGQLQLDANNNPDFEAVQLDYTTDARLVLDQLAQWQTSDPFLAGRLDLDHIGAFGWAVGGSVAANLANVDARCKAAANLCGEIRGAEPIASGCTKPYLMLRDDVSESTTDNPLTFLQRCQAAAYYLKLARSHSFGFGEFQFLVTPTRAAQLTGWPPLDALQTQDFARSALLSFFRRHLKSEEDGVLDGLATNSLAIARAIRMNGGPVVSTSLNATNIYIEEGLSLSVTATGQDPLTYEWFADGVLLPEVTGDTLTIPAVTTASAAQYTVRVSDANGCTTCSAPITVQPLRFTTQPKDVKAAIGGTASFQVTVQSTEPVTYQWQHNGQDIADATDANLVLSGLQADTIGTYSVKVSNCHGSLQTTNARLYLRPYHVEVPQYQILPVGADLELTGRLVGSLPMNYRWYRDWVLQSGLTRDNPTSTLSVPNVQLSDAGVYKLTVTNAAGLSSQGNIDTPVLVVQPPTNQVAAVGSTLTFAAKVARGSANTPGLQWQYAGVDIEGATSESLTLTNVQSADAGIYTFIVTNNINLSTSFSATLNVIGK